MSTIAERVAAGAAFLDAETPGWWARIDLETFDISSPCKCVLGQVYAEAAEADGDEDGFDHGTLRGADAVAMGFDVPCGDDHTNYPPLEAEWKRLIEARRSA